MKTRRLGKTVFVSFFAFFILFSLVHPAFAVLSSPPSRNSIDLDRVKDILLEVIDYVWKIFITISIIMFIYAGFLFVTAAGNESQTSTARRAVIWACVGITVGLIGFSIEAIIRSALQI